MFEALDLTFLHPGRLYWLIPGILIIAGLYTSDFQAKIQALKENPFLRLHAEEVRPSGRVHLVRALVLSAILTLLGLAWAEPQHKTEVGEPVYGGVRVAFLQDVSLSMKLAHDVAPYPDRLAAAKDILASFAAMTVNDRQLKGTYWLAVIPFAGTALTHLPFTASYDEFLSAVNEIDETVIKDSGTNLLAPFLEYERMIKNYPLKNSDMVDILVLLSDGGQEEGTYEDVPYVKSALLRMKKVIVYTVGIGSVAVTTLPDGTEIRKSLKVPLMTLDHNGKVISRELEDPNDPHSQRVYRSLDERILKEIAGEGHYVHYTGKDALLQKLKQAIIEHRTSVDALPHSRIVPVAWWFLVPAILLAFLMFGYLRRLLFLPKTVFRLLSG